MSDVNDRIKEVFPDALELSFFTRKERVFLRYTMTYHNITKDEFNVIKDITENTYQAIGNDIVEIVINSDKLPDEYYEISVNISSNDISKYIHNIAKELSMFQ